MLSYLLALHMALAAQARDIAVDIATSPSSDVCGNASAIMIGSVASPSTHDKYIQAKLPIAYILTQSEEQQVAMSNGLEATARKYCGIVNFVTVGPQDSKWKARDLSLDMEAKLDHDSWPAFAILEPQTRLKFPLLELKGADFDTISHFVERYLAGNVKPTVRSEPLPAEGDDSPVRALVAHNFNDIVLNSTKDVLVEFYNPTCGPCKALAPKWDALGTLFQGESFIVIAKIDETANDVPVDIFFYPTIMLFRAGDKASPISYGGNCNLVDLTAFIQEHSRGNINLLSKARAIEAAQSANVSVAQAQSRQDQADASSDELELSPWVNGHTEL